MALRVSAKEVLELLGIEDRSLLEELRREGLFEEEELEEQAAEELRVAACLMRDLGVNPAGVEVALHMRRRILVLQERIQITVRRLLDESDGD